MTIMDIMNMFTERDLQNIYIYDLDTDETLFDGLYWDMPFYLKHYSISSIDNLNDSDILTINVDSSIQ